MTKRYFDVVRCAALYGSNMCRPTFADGSTERTSRLYFVLCLEALGHRQAGEMRKELLETQRARPVR